MAAVGFDIGNENSYIAAVKSGGIEILDNEYSLRSTPTYVAFTERSRDVGIAAKAKLVTNLENTVFGFKKLLGRKYRDPEVNKYLAYLPHEVSELSSGDIGIKVNYLKNCTFFSVSQLMAIILTKLKMITESKLGHKIRDCVICVPVFYTDAQRRAMLEAAKIADLKVLKLMNESTAIALAYGFYKQDLSEEQSLNIIFVDLGNSSVTVTACAFTKEKLKILGCVWDDVGGRDFDNKLVQYFLDDFKDRYQLDVMSNKKAVISLMLECETLKKLMSANSLELGIQMECFMNDLDVTGRMKRDRFENLSVDILSRIEIALQNILVETKLELDKIHSVEIVGGSCRVPAVKLLIQKIFGREPNSTLNLDEAVARGCALQCALLSPSLKTRDFVCEDISPYVIKMMWKNMESEDEEIELFSHFDKVPAFKGIILPMRKPFTFKVCYVNMHVLSENHEIGIFTIGNFPNEVNETAKTKLKACLNIHGIFSITAAKLIMKNYQTEIQTVSCVNKIGNIDDTSKGENLMDTGEKIEQDVKDENTIVSYVLTVTSNVPGLSEMQLNEFIDAEKQMIHKYIEEKEKADARNSFEEYIYDIRGRLNYALNDYVTEKDKTKLLKYLNETENWLYDNEDQAAVEYSKKLRDMKIQFDPIFKRLYEWENRPVIINKCLQTLQKSLDPINELMNFDKANVHKEKIYHLQMQCHNFKQFLNQLNEKLSTFKKYEDASVTVEELKEALSKFQDEYHKSFTDLKAIINASLESAEASVGDGNPAVPQKSNTDEQQIDQDVDPDKPEKNELVFGI